MKKRLSNLEGHYIICGLGRVGMTVLERLKKQNADICVIDMGEQFVESLQEQDIPFVIGSAIQDDILEEAGIKKAKALLAILPSDADNLYLTLAAKDLNPKISIVARASDSNAYRRLTRSGADHVVSPYTIAGRNMTNALLYPTLTEIIDGFSDPDTDVEMQEITIIATNPICNKSIAESNIRSYANVIILALKCENQNIEFNPLSDQILKENSIIVVLGEKVEIQKLLDASN